VKSPFCTSPNGIAQVEAVEMINKISQCNIFFSSQDQDNGIVVEIFVDWPIFIDLFGHDGFSMEYDLACLPNSFLCLIRHAYRGKCQKHSFISSENTIKEG
jgi:hypothetical protein